MPRDHLLPRFELQCGAAVEGLRLRYEVHGTLNAARDNAVLFPTWFGGRHASNAWIIGPGRGLDTSRYCVIVVDAFGNGESSSPSNHQVLANGGHPLPITLLDNVRAQRALVTALGVDRLHAIVGRSMGAQQALQWSCMYPQAAGRIFAFCGLPRTTQHNKLLLQAIIDVLQQGLEDGRHPESLDTAAAIYAPWTLSHEFFNNGVWKTSAGSPAQWCRENVARTFRQFHPADLLCLAKTWQAADISDNTTFRGDFEAALRSITAPVLLMPISHDLIFPPQDFKAAEQRIPHACSRVLSSEWGHRAAAPGGSAEDVQALETALRDFISPPLSTTDSLALVSGRVWLM
jgi:homoserine O-acetyltransferase/O-succinyltransferase